MLLLVHANRAKSDIVYPRDGSDLKAKLCERQLTGNNTIILKESTVYTMSSNNTAGYICTVKNTNDEELMVTIKSANPSCSSIITCDNTSSYRNTMLFYFFNVSVNLIGINITNCGSRIIIEQPTYANCNRSFQFNNTHSAALLFDYCNLTINRMSVTNYHGYALVAVNARNITTDCLIIKNQENWNNDLKAKSHSNGSGLLILFDDCIKHNAVVSLNNSNFTKNIEYYKPGLCFASFFFSVWKNKNKITNVVNAAGITIYMYHRNFIVSIAMNNIHVIDNHGTIAAGILIVMLPHSTGTTEISDSYFSGNTHHFACSGSDLAFYSFSVKTVNPFSLMRTIINESGNQYGSVLIGTWKPLSKTQGFKIDNVTFSGIQANGRGICLSATVYGRHYSKHGSVKITLTGILAHDNGHDNNGRLQSFIPSNLGIFSFRNIDKIFIMGNASFPTIFENNIGSVIQGANSDIFLNGNVTFRHNYAVNGGALYLINCFLYFLNNTQHIVFQNNTAISSGGAIYATKTVYSAKPSCVFRFNNNNTSIKFINNAAEVSGNSIFANPIYDCFFVIGNESNYLTTSSQHMYSSLFTISSKNVTNNCLNISSYVTSVGIENHENIENRSHYFGETIEFRAYAKDGSNKFVYTSVKITIPNMQYHIATRTEEIQQIIESNNNKSTHLTIRMQTDNPVMKNVSVIVYVISYNSNKFVAVHLKMSPCPIGFNFNKKGFCECHPLLQSLQKEVKPNHISCDINTQMIDTSYRFLWLGFTQFNHDNNKTFSISFGCPMSFCNLWKVSGNLTSKSSDSEIYIFTYHHHNHTMIPLCQGNRIGVLCGQCKKGFSVVFGSSDCHKCTSNTGIFVTILVTLLGGVLVIVVLYTLKLTLTAGTLNGMIFYSQLMQVTVVPYLTSLSEDGKVQFFRVVIFFISILNLEISFPICFFNKMDELWKTGLNLLFPIYLLFIVVLLIFLSKFSSWLSTRTSHSSVQVLVTVIHLSFAKFLIAFANTVTWSKVHIGNYNTTVHVWTNDGSVKYRQDKGHIILLIFTSMMVAIFVLPYFILLLAGRYLMRVSSKANKYLRHFYEAIHGPFKENHKYWFAARLILLLILFVLFSFLSLRLSGSIGWSLLIVFTIVQAYNKPFKTKLLNVIDITIMKLSIAIYTCIVYFTKDFQVQNEVLSKLQYVSMSFIFSVSMIMFVFIVVYHFMQVTGLSKRLIIYIDGIKSSYFSGSQELSIKTSLYSNAGSSFYDSIANYREPLLSDAD